MRVADIKADAQQVLGYCSDTTLYNRLSQAVEVLANEGNWDSLEAYLDIPVAAGGVVTLPRDVETPIEININTRAAFSRSKLYEFSINGPGNDMKETSGFSWMDKVNVPVMRQPGGTQIAAFARNPLDIGKFIRIWGYDINSVEVSDVITLAASATPPNMTTTVYKNITRVNKDVTVGIVDLVSFANPNPIPPVPPPPPVPVPPGPPPGVQVPDPFLNPIPGLYSGVPFQLQVTTLLRGASMRYTLDGTDPSPTNGTLIGDNATVLLYQNTNDFRIIAFQTGLQNSNIVRGIYTLLGLPSDKVPDPRFKPPGGTYTINTPRMNISIGSSVPTAKLSITFDGSDPTTTHGTIVNQNTWNFTAGSGTQTVKVMAFADGLTNSNIITQIYNITYQPLSPTEPVSVPPQPLVAPNLSFILLASYYGNEVDPTYRQIQLTKGASLIRMLYRRKTYKVFSDDDWIPLRSTMAILTMLKALEAIRNGTTEELAKVDNYMKQAVYFLKQEQASRMNFDLAAQSESPSTLSLGYVNADSLIVADIYDDACAIFGPIGRTNIFDRITDALEILNNCGQWDGLVGFVDLLTDNHRYITLPRYVESPIAINVNGRPKVPRNKWFEFHLNGPGSGHTAFHYWDDVGSTVTIRPLPMPMQLVARNDLISDEGRKLTIFGYDRNGKWLRSFINGTWADGLVITTSQAGVRPSPHDTYVARIERIVKEESDGYIQLMGWVPPFTSPVPNTVSLTTSASTAAGFVLPFNSTAGVVAGMGVTGLNIPAQTTVKSVTTNSITLIFPITNPIPSLTVITFIPAPITLSVTVPLGFYYPDETEPNYRRIKLNQRCAGVRMRYRKRHLKIFNLTDPIHLKNKLAVCTALYALKALHDGDTDKSQALEVKAIEYLQREQSSRNPAETFQIQVEGMEAQEVII